MAILSGPYLFKDMLSARMMSLEAVLNRLKIDPYILAMLTMVGLAAVLPARDIGKDVLNIVVYGAISLLFFTYGANISPKAIWDGLANWRLQSLVFATSYVVFPVLGFIIVGLTGGLLESGLATGLLFLCLLPSTVQSSIVFTSIARGNIPAALCCASLSNLAGVIITPLLATYFLSLKTGSLSLDDIRNIALQILLPFLVGQIARPLISDWLGRHAKLTKLFDRGAILLVVYSAFSAGVVAGIWSLVTVTDLAFVVAFSIALLFVVLVFTTMASRLLRFPAEDEIAIVFCGSKKSLASGLPMANIIFPASTVGMIVLPLMLFHQMQLIACAVLARRYSLRTEKLASTVSEKTS